MNTWAPWIACATLFVAVGKFLDQYHIRNATRSAARDFLVRAFMWLDARIVPDYGKGLLRLASFFTSRRIVAGAIFLLLFGPVGAITVFYIGRLTFGPQPESSYFYYLASWMDLGSLFWIYFLAVITAGGSLAAICAAYFNHLASICISDWRRVMLLLAGLIIPACLIRVTVFIILKIFAGGGYMIGTVIWAVFLSAVPFMFLESMTLLTIFVTLALKLLRAVCLNVFDSASDPRTSPFLYGFSFLGLGTLIAKTLLELLNV